MAETLPIINGSSGTWGSILNVAIGNIDAKLAAAIQKNTDQDTALTTQAGKITALENKNTVGLLATSTSSTRPPASVGLMGLETDTGYMYYCASIGGVATRVPWPGSPLAKLRQTTSQNIPVSTATAITFQIADLNRLGGWTSGTRYTAQVPGQYEITGAITFAANSAGNRNAILFINGSGNGVNASAGSSPGTVTGASITQLRPTVITLNVGDYIELKAWQTSTATVATDVVTPSGVSGMQVKYLGYYGS